MRKSIFVLGIALLGVTIFYGDTANANDILLCRDEKTSPDQKIQACSRLIDSGRYGGQQLGGAYALRGVAFINRGDNERALSDLNIAIKHAPKVGTLYSVRCWALVNLRQLDRAVADCEYAIRVSPKSPDGYANLCLARIRQSKVELALDSCNRAIELDPKLAIAYLNRCVAWAQKANWGRGLVDCNRAIELLPNNSTAYASRCHVFVLKNDLDGAMSDCNRAVALDAKSSINYIARCSVLTASRNFADALKDCARAEQLDPNSVSVYSARGTLYTRMKDLTNAIAAYDRGLQIDSANADLLNGRCYANATLGGNTIRALADCNEAIRIAPENGFFFDSRCEVFTRLQRPEEALADCNRAVRLGPSLPHPYVRRGIIEEGKGEREQARADFNHALTLTNNDPWAHETAKEHLVALSAVAQKPQVAPTITAAPAGRRVALVLGNSDYQNVPSLANPRQDAIAVAAALRSVGFQIVTVNTDVSKEAMINALRSFAREADSADWALVYLAGHGVEVNGVNYFIPIDAKLAADRDVEFEAISLAQVLASVEDAKKLKLVILDACRDNPFVRQMRRSVATRSVGRGLARIEPEAGSLVVFSAKAGETALDGDGGNSPFAAALVKEMLIPGIEIRRLFDLVRDEVMETTKRQQQPYTYGSVSGRQDFYFVQK